MKKESLERDYRNELPTLRYRVTEKHRVLFLKIPFSVQLKFSVTLCWKFIAATSTSVEQVNPAFLIYSKIKHTGLTSFIAAIRCYL